MHSTIIDVQTGEVKIGTGECILKSEGIGSCVVVVAWDSGNKNGAMAHIMLPGKSQNDSGKEPKNRYAIDAIDTLLSSMSSVGSDKKNMEVCLVGGANILKRVNDTIGKDIIDAVLKILDDKKIKIAVQRLCGTKRRSVTLDVETGIIAITEGDEKETIVWDVTKSERKITTMESDSLQKSGNSKLSEIKKNVVVSEKVDLVEKTYDDRQRIAELEASQFACLNIMQDLEIKRKEMENVQKAYLNIMQDMELKNSEIALSKVALINTMQELAISKKKTDELNDVLEQKVEAATRELRESTAQLVQSEKMSALGELTAGVAHELNQPLNVIKIIAQSILREAKKSTIDPTTLEEDLNDVISQINRMAAIITHMRIFTRNTSEDAHQRVNLNSVVENALMFHEMQLRNRNIKLTCELAENLPDIQGNPIRLEQVIINLMTNARDSLEKKSDKKLSIRTYLNEKSNSVIEFKDNGCGIPEEIIKKIFNPFFTTKEPGKGTGLGLSVSMKIIEEHRGKIDVESIVGEGAVFRIQFPAE